MTDDEPDFDDAKARLLFEHQERLLASLETITTGLAEQAPKAMTAVVGVQLLGVAGIGIPKHVADPLLEAINAMGSALAMFKTAVEATQKHE